ncbi:flagellar basal body rod protein FlgC [Acidaminobacterium chupaoyuni]
MALLTSLDVAGSALTAERYRTDVIMQNIANAKTTVTENGEPYRRKQVVFEERPLTFREALGNARAGGVKIAEVVESQREFNRVYDPTHPQADAAGYVNYPNVNTTEEMIDLMAASNAYEANLTALSVVKATIAKTLELGK